MNKVIDVVTDHGVPFRAVFAADGAKPYHNFGKGAPTIAFYDRRYPHTPNGRFIIHYYAATIANSGNAGLCLNSDNADWHIDADTMQAVKVWLHSQLNTATV